MGQRTLVPDAGEVVLDEVRALGRGRLVLVLRSAGEESRCPACAQSSRRVHSRYSRQLKDLPWEGIPVGIELRVRRFFCDVGDCAQHIFTERLPNTVKRYGRRTCRVSVALEKITLALGGSAGSRLAEQLGIIASGSTLLRDLRKRARAVSVSPRVVGIDDWAWRKGQRYGTIVCDLERGKVIDLLPDRSAESTAAWLRNHPGIEIVSRDRAGLYAQAVDRAAPRAIQVADRWHLLRNLSEALIGVLAPHHRLMTEAARAVAKAPEAPLIQPSSATSNKTRAERAKQRSRDSRMIRYASVMEHLRNGLSQAEISRTMDIDRRTIRRWTRSGNFPERKPVMRTSSVEEYRRYLDQRWEQGCHNASQLWREIHDLGFTGRHSIVRNWIRKIHGPKTGRFNQAPFLPPPPRVSPRQTAWQFLKQCELNKPYLDELCRRSPEIATSTTVAREFFRLVQQRDLSAWTKWRESARHSALSSFASHLCRDEAAVLAALKYDWSNGPVEGNVHRLKLIKRSMYGRASFDLLRLRVVTVA
jgi:transposase